VTISYGIRTLTRALSFDHLVLALGSETNYSGIPGIADNALGIKTLGDAAMLRAKVIAMLELASVDPDPDRRKRILTFVVAGGGFANSECGGRHESTRVLHRACLGATARASGGDGSWRD
jgi:NADH dehydrogenase FAD-containing subunit